MVDMVKATQHVFHVLNELRDNLYANCGISQGDVIASSLLYTLINANANCSSIEKKWAEDLINKRGVRHIYFDEREKDFINKSIAALRIIDKDIFTNIYVDAVEWIIQEVFASQQYGQFSQPVDITMLVGDIVRSYAISSIYNPFAGLGSYAEISDSIHYYGQEIDELVHLFGKIRLKSLGYKVSEYKLEDSFACWDDHKVDCIVSTPPFAIKLPYNNGLSRNTDAGLYLIDKFINSAVPYAVFVLPTGLCSRQSKDALDIRKDIINRSALEMVIELPKGEFYPSSGISTSIIVLNKKRAKGEPVLFVDASDLCRNGSISSAKVLDVDSVIETIKKREDGKCSVLVSNNEICDLDLNWQASYYIDYKNEIFPDGYTVLSLIDVLEPIKRDKSFNERNGHLVKIADLPSEIGDYTRNPKDFKKVDLLPQCYKVEEPALLLSTIGVLKPTYCIASPKNPIFLHPHVVAYRIRQEWVNPIYLCMEISRRKAPVSGMVIPSINRNQINHLRVAFPSIDSQNSFNEQEILYKEYIEGNRIARAKESGLLDIIDKMKSEYIMEVRNRKHDMKTPMTQLRNTLTLLEVLANKLPEEFAPQLHNYISRQKVALDTLSEIVRHLADEDVFSEPEVLELETVLSSFACKNEKYSIVYVPDSLAINEAVGKGKAKVYIGKSDLLRLINNIIGNAVDHGFVENKTNYELLITLSTEGDSYLIVFTNNGKPLPDGMDKARYGMKGVKGKDSEGQGTGGYVVKSIVEHYGGDYDVLKRKWAGRTLTDVIIKLPIYRGDE